MTKQQLIPDASHPITITPQPAVVVVRAKDQAIATSRGSVSLQEAAYPAVVYVPITDVDPGTLQRSDTTSYCPYKGDATYYDLVTSDGVITDAVWEYLEPYDAVAEVKGRVAFYPNKVAISIG